jgi:hypothetical protein
MCYSKEDGMTADIRWFQRLENYSKVLQRLKDAMALAAERPLTDLEKQGLIQAFEFTHELAWNTIKDFYEFRESPGYRGAGMRRVSLSGVD